MTARLLVTAVLLALALVPRQVAGVEKAKTPNVLQKDSEAYLSTDELREGLQRFTEDDKSRVANAAVLIGDSMRGQELFRRCRACHSAKSGGGHKIGPNLYGVVGRPIAKAPDYSYSPALSAVRRRWDEATLDQWLTAPKRFAAGTLMTFPGLKDAQDRADVIAYLKKQSK